MLFGECEVVLWINVIFLKCKVDICKEILVSPKLLLLKHRFKQSNAVFSEKL